MNTLAGILILAGLFVLFGLMAARYGERRKACGSCSDRGGRRACARCPLRDAPEEKTAP